MCEVTTLYSLLIDNHFYLQKNKEHIVVFILLVVIVLYKRCFISMIRVGRIDKTINYTYKNNTTAGFIIYCCSYSSRLQISRLNVQIPCVLTQINVTPQNNTYHSQCQSCGYFSLFCFIFLKKTNHYITPNNS